MLFRCLFTGTAESRLGLVAQFLLEPSQGSAQLRQEGAVGKVGVSSNTTPGTRDNVPWVPQEALAAWDPSESEVEVGALLEKDFEQEGLCEDPQDLVCGAGRAAHMPC